MTLADRVVVMNKGVIEQAAEPIELYENPAKTVAGFIGVPSMNFLPGTVVARDGGLGLTIGDGTTLPIPQDREGRYGPYRDCPVLFGIRPEHMEGWR